MVIFRGYFFVLCGMFSGTIIGMIIVIYEDLFNGIFIGVPYGMCIG